MKILLALIYQVIALIVDVFVLVESLLALGVSLVARNVVHAALVYKLLRMRDSLRELIPHAINDFIID